MSEFRVLNARVSPKIGVDRVYIGRPSKWGNPFVIGEDGTRAQVIEKYREYLLTNANLMADLPELSGKHLVCWCVPLACHGHILLDFANGKPLPSPPTDGEG